MQKTNLTITETLVALSCGHCGTYFAMTETLYNRRLGDGQGFYCPNGHSRIFSQKQDLEKQLEEAKNQAAALSARNDQLAKSNSNLHARITETERSLSAHKGMLTKARKRAENGVCQYCNRTFTQLERHMQSKHPDHAHPDPNQTAEARGKRAKSAALKERLDEFDSKTLKP